jgi:16S rRNA (uracil1498-N3)-methyltransferase
MPSRADAAPSYVWAAAIPAAGSRIALDEQESHYVTKVCRVRAGESVTLTDGRGTRAQGVVIQLGEVVTLEMAEVEWQARERTATCLVGAPERGRADWMVEKLAELGVEYFLPIDTERSRWASSEVRLERWGRLARAALRQSRRCHEMDVHPPAGLAESIGLTVTLRPAESTRPAEEPGRRYLADSGGTPSGRLIPQAAGRTVAVVGPAEGFSTDERNRLTSAGFVPISLSDGRLRTETAAIALAAWWSGGA